DKLVKDVKLTKTYGGAVLENPVSEDPSFIDRLKVNMKQKKSIGAKAAELIKDGETIFIDMSTTALEVIKSVPDNIEITVITNSFEAIIELKYRVNIRLVMIGGTFDKANLFMGGSMANRFIEHYYVDKTFFSVKALSKNRGLMDSKEEIAEIKSKMVQNAREAILVIDGSKVDKTALFNVITMDQISTIVTDYILDQQWLDILESHNIDGLMV
nr:DeoR/GlpR family DNA-binding transcription regulator [Vallitaleaceae bacterium]